GVYTLNPDSTNPGEVHIYHRSGNLMVSHSTITGNSAPSNGGGIRNNDGGTMATRNSIIAGNTALLGPDVFGNLGSLGSNLISNPQEMTGWVGTDILHVNPPLEPLHDNSGPPRTHPPLPRPP